MTTNPWEDENSPWKNSVAFFTYLRGCLRAAWSKSPQKHNLIKKKRYQIANPSKNAKKPTVWGFRCEMCQEEFVMSMCQVDHIHPAGSLQKREDIQGFVERLLFVTEDDLRLVCKPCNNALSMSDKTGMTYEEAIVEKKVIAIMRDKQDKQFLIDNGVEPLGNANLRRIQVKGVLTK